MLFTNKRIIVAFPIVLGILLLGIRFRSPNLPWFRYQQACQTVHDPFKLVELAITATGGSEKLAAPKHGIDAGVVYFAEPAGLIGEFRLYWNGSQRRSDWDVRGYQSIECISRRTAWRESEGIVNLLRPGQEPKIDLDTVAGWDVTHLGRVRQWMRKKSGHLKYIGCQTLPGGVIAEGVSVAVPDGRQLLMYFEPTTHLVAAICFCLGQDHSPGYHTYLTRFLDRRSENGIPVSRRQLLYIDGRLDSTTVIKSMDRRDPVSDSIFAPPPMQTPQKTTVVPFAYLGLPIVTVLINGNHPCKLIVDTGAYETLLTPEAVARLGLHTSGQFPGSSWEISSSNGVYHSYHLQSIQVGASKIQDLSALSFQTRSGEHLVEGGVDGSLGYNFLGHFQVTLDYASKRLTLAPRDTPLPISNRTPFTLKNDQVWIETKTKGGNIPLCLDTGGSVVEIPPGEIEHLLHGPVFDDGPRTLWGRNVRMHIARVPFVSVGKCTVRNIPVSFLSPGAFDAQDEAHGTGQLGSSFLEHCRVTVDYARQWARFEPVMDRHGDQWTGPGLDLGAKDEQPIPRVNVVVADSPAQRAGVQVGDEVTEINGKTTNGVARWVLWYWLRGRVGTEVTIRTTRAGCSKVFKLTRVRLL